MAPGIISQLGYLEAQRDRPGQQLYIVHSEDTWIERYRPAQKKHKEFTILNYESFWIFFTPFIMHLYIKVHIKAYELKNQNLV
jgi:tRNA(Phe) wybutosine-synthesizing methylase Tyw3